MRFRSAVVFSAVFVIALAVVAWTSPIASAWSSAGEPSPTVESASGKISSIGSCQFSVDTEKDRKAKTLEFLIDDDTKIDGQLIVGAEVSVEYRINGDKFVATHVTITPVSEAVGVNAREILTSLFAVYFL